MADKNWQMPSNTIRLSATKSGDKRRFSWETVPPGTRQLQEGKHHPVLKLQDRKQKGYYDGRQELAIYPGPIPKLQERRQKEARMGDQDLPLPDTPAAPSGSQLPGRDTRGGFDGRQGLAEETKGDCNGRQGSVISQTPGNTIRFSGNRKGDKKR